MTNTKKSTTASWPDMTFADTIKSERARLRLTQADAASLLDVPARTLWEWEHGKTEPLSVAQEGVIARLKKAKVKNFGVKSDPFKNLELKRLRKIDREHRQ